MARKIICLAGSTKFKSEFTKQHRRLTIEGFIVFLPAIYAKSGDVVSEKEQQGLSLLFADIILICDILFVINPGGYIGESTASEIEFAKSNGKEISFMVPIGSSEKGAEEDTCLGSNLQPLFDLMREEHGLTLVQSEMLEICEVAEKCVFAMYEPEANKTRSQPNMSSSGCEAKLLEVVKRAYCKHVKDDPEIGWNELGTELMTALCCAMGEDGFIKWNGS